MTYVEYKQLNPFQRFAYNLKKFFCNIPHAVGHFFVALGKAIVKFFVGIGKGFANYGKTFVKGDWATKLSYLIFGVGDLSKGKYYKGILFFAVEVLYILYMVFFGWGYLRMFPTLGTQAQRTEYINGVIPKQVPGDNSMLILLYSVLTLVITVVVFAIYITNIKDAYRHRYLSAQFIAKVGEVGMTQILRRAIAQDVHFYDSFFRIEDCKAKREAILRQKRLDELKQQHIQELASKEKKHSEKVESIENEALEFAEDAERKQLEAQDRAAHFEEENKKLREENYNLRSENDSYRLLAKENADLKKVCNNRLATKEYPQTPQDIVHYYDASFGDKIAFSDDAMDSLKDCTIPLEDLWEALFALATIMDDLYINGSGDIFTECRNKSGVDVRRGEGSETRKDSKLMRQYETEYHGEMIDIEAHITYSKIGQSIHFGFSQKDQKLIVGWCGEHKDNYTTRKVH